MLDAIHPYLDDPERHRRWCEARSKIRRDQEIARRRIRDRDISKAIRRIDRLARLVDVRGEAWLSRHRTAARSLVTPRVREAIRAGEDRPRFAERAKTISIAWAFAPYVF